MSRLPKKPSLASKLRSTFFFPIRLVVGFLVELGKFRIWAAVTLLTIVILIGDSLTRDGLVLALVIFAYAMLYYLDRWFEKREQE
jgi:hypothetical protein